MNKVSAKKKLYILNEPKILILIGALASAVLGLCLPLWGVFMGRYMNILSQPISSVGGSDRLRDQIYTETSYVAVIAFTVYFSSMIQQKAFSRLNETVTYKIRTMQYSKILEKNIGWFDLKENSTSVLTTSIAEDPSIVNMSSGQSVGPMLEGMFALFGAVIIALINCWQYALICMGLISIWIGTMTLQTNLLKA